jgi:prepilin-type N-terminal cleavage/methylation domain-containing protein
MKQARRGFTLIELLVVVAIIALLIAILIPSLGKARELSRRSATLAQMHAIGIGMASYQGDFDKALPTNLTDANPDARTFEGLAVLAKNNAIPAKFFINPQLPDTPATATTAEGLLVFADLSGTPITLTTPIAALTSADMANVRFHCSFAYDHEPKKGEDANRMHIYVADRADYANGRAITAAWGYKGICTLWSDQHAEFIKSTAVAEQSDPNIYHHNQYYDDAGVAGAGEGAGEVQNGVTVGPATIDTHLRFFSEDEDDALLPNP